MLKNLAKVPRKPDVSSRVLQRQGTSQFFDDPPHGAVNPMLDEKVTIVDLGRLACGRHPDIAAQDGKFSTELFQVMHGIPLLESTPRADSATQHPVAEVEKVQKPDKMCRDVSDVTVASGEKGSNNTPNGIPHVHSSLQLESCYADLSPDVQAIIFAGRVGKPMKRVEMRSSQPSSDDKAYGLFAFFATSGTLSSCGELSYTN